MNHDTAMLALAILIALGGWTATVAGLVLWLAGRFRSLERLIYQQVNRLRDRHERKMELMARRLMRLEMRVFGHTETLTPHEGGDEETSPTGE